MQKIESSRHQVALAGTITDSVTGKPMRQALVEILLGPAAHQAKVDILARDPAWLLRNERFDRTHTRGDGLFFFIDLAPGDYTLRVSAPQLGTRYGVIEAGPFTVQTGRDANGRVRVAQADVTLAPTLIQGQVIRGDNSQAVAGAQVRLRGDTHIVVTAADGQYRLLDIVASKLTVEVSAANFQTAQRTVNLAAGQARTVNITLQPGG